MEIEEMRTMLKAGHECGKDVKLWLGDCYEDDQTTPHVCDPTYVTNYWRVTNKAGELLHVVFGNTEHEAREHAKRSLKVRKCKAKEGSFELRRMKSEEYSAYVRTEYDS